MLPTRAEETLYAAAQASTCMAMFQLYQATPTWMCVHFVLCPSSVGRRPTRPLSSSCPPPPCPRQRKGQSPSPHTRHTLRISANRQPILSPGVLLETHRALTYVSTRASAHPHAGASACSSEWVSVVHVVTIFVAMYLRITLQVAAPFPCLTNNTGRRSRRKRSHPHHRMAPLELG